VTPAAHCYGGAVITQAGADDPKVKGLIHAAAIVPAAGEAATNLLEWFPDHVAAERWGRRPFRHAA
jgi:hypothetical protein